MTTAINYEQETIVAVFAYNVFSDPDSGWCCYRFIEQETDRKFMAVGSMLPDKKNLPVKLTGHWEYDKWRGAAQKKFCVDYTEIAPPSRKAEVVAYFGSLKCGIGKTKAESIYSRFGDKTYEIVDNDPERLVEVRGISTGIVSDLKEALKKSNAARDLIRLFSGAGVNVNGNMVHGIINLYPENTVDVVRENPFAPIGVEGYTFEKADSLRDAVGLPADFPPRLEAGIIRVLDNFAVAGNVCMPAMDLLNGMMRMLKSSKELCQEALKKAQAEGKIKVAMGMVYTPARYLCEEAICKDVVRLMSVNTDAVTKIDPFIEEYERDNFTLADCQKDAVRNAFAHPLSIITGGPGTGKSTVTKAILYANQQIYGESAEPVLLAPTGKASRRMSEVTGYPAATIHSTVGWRGDEKPTDNEIEIEGNLVIVDEASMMDQTIASVLLEKIRTGTRVVFVGDVDQLPSVGAGDVLADMIGSEVIPTTRLNVIFRQAGENPIIKNAHAINNGDTNLVAANTFKFYVATDPQNLFNQALSLYCKVVKKYGDDKVVLLNPQRNNTDVSVDNFNVELQKILNPKQEGQKEITVGKTKFRAGDKIMELKNTEGPKNGDVGYIREIVWEKSSEDEDSGMYFANIEFNNDGITCKYNVDDLRHVTHAWCTTVHKSQGSEYDTVIMVVSKAHPTMLKRNLLYTGVTRAKKNVCIVGEPDALTRAILDGKREVRCTMLAIRLHTALTKKKENV